MPKYSVDIQQWYSSSITVEADTLKQAVATAQGWCDDGSIASRLKYGFDPIGGYFANEDGTEEIDKED